MITTLAVLVTTYVLSNGIHFQKPLDLIMASLLLGILNAVVRPFLMVLSLPLVLLTLGLFTLVINGILLFVVSALLRPRFEVENFKYAFWGAVLISVFSMILNALTGTGKRASRCAKDHLLLLLPMTILRQGAGRSLTSDLAQIEALLAATTHVHCIQNRSTGTKFRAGRNITQCSLRATRTLKRPKQRTHIWKCRRKIKKFALQTQESGT